MSVARMRERIATFGASIFSRGLTFGSTGTVDTVQNDLEMH